MRQDHPPTVTTTEVQRMLCDDAPTWIIHAGAVAFTVAHIPGALVTDDAAVLGALAARGPVVVYGADADDAVALALCRSLAAAHRGRVRWYAGGLAAWRASGLPVDTTTATGG